MGHGSTESPVTVAVLAPAGSTQAELIADALGALAPVAGRGPVEVARLAIAPDRTAPLTLDGTEIWWDQLRLDRIDALYFHGFGFEQPVIPPPAPLCDWSLWQVGALIAQQGWSALFSVLSRLEAAGTPRLVNPPSARLAGFALADSLDRLGRAGIPVAPWLVTNDGAAADRFTADHEVTVWRPITGGGAWQPFRERQRRDLIALDQPPVLLAQVVAGPLARAYVTDGTIVLIASQVPPGRDAAGIEQLEQFRVLDAADLPGTDRLVAAAAALGLAWAMVTFVVTDAGPVIYDIDPDPVITDLPTELARGVAGALAARLAGAPAPPPLAAGDVAVERPTLLLRRMLQLPFELETLKYRTTAEPAAAAPDV